MKLSNAFIQAIAVLVMLAELPDDSYLKASEISQRMGVSHSYLQKIAKKLNTGGIIKSEASKKGGYSLNKEVKNISFYDVFRAVETKKSFLGNLKTDIFHSMFLSNELVHQYGNLTVDILNEAEETYLNILKKHSIEEIVPKDSEGELLKIDWRQYLQNNK
ncbi:RrF2 family transcriptional regulator [Enterococcus sp. DIV0800]|uniref:RrF2 family transcriptional regulator n=1 Tax=unclassified Enterococcus TaxID=2608891 RepID=UPI003D2FE251